MIPSRAVGWAPRPSFGEWFHLDQRLLVIKGKQPVKVLWKNPNTLTLETNVDNIFSRNFPSGMEIFLGNDK